MKKQKIFWILTLAFFLLQLVAEIMLAVAVQQLNMLPDNYAGIFFGVLALFALLVGFLGLFHRSEKQVGTARRIVAAVLSLLIAAGCFLGWQVSQQVNSTMEEITTPEPTVPSRAVFVRMDDSAQTLEDTKDYVYGITTDYDADACLNVQLTIEERLQTQLQTSAYDTALPMVDALLNGQIDAMILNSGYLSVLDGEPDYENIHGKIRILEQIPLVERELPQQTEPTETTEPPTEPPVVENITNTPFIIYFSGLDMRGKNLGVSRSDVNILAVVNPSTKQILLVNTPRDYYVPHPDSSYGTKDKLTHFGIYGIDCSIRALESLYGVQINYHAQINFSGFEKLIDEMGGVTVNSDRSFTAYDDFNNSYYIQKGANSLNGKAALAYARDRYHQAAGDNDRGRNQMKVIQAVIAKATSGSTIISNYSGILSSLSGMFTTSMSMDDISLLVKMQLTDMASWNVQSYAVIGTGGSSTTYSMPDLKAYVTYPNEDSVAFGSQLIQRVLDGETLTPEDVIFNK